MVGEEVQLCSLNEQSQGKKAFTRGKIKVCDETDLGDISGMNLLDTELTLGLPGGENPVMKTASKRAFSEREGSAINDLSVVSDQRSEDGVSGAPPEAPSTKEQVVGWPPVRSYRRNVVTKTCKYVKVAADGAPYLRKVDLGIYGSYDELLAALENGFIWARGYVATYDDRDGDSMLVGDVPWKMFIETCKRIRLMKISEAMGFDPRTPDVTSTSLS